MAINSEPTLKTHILTTQEATNLIDWHYNYSPVKGYPHYQHIPVKRYYLPTEIVLWPKKGYKVESGDTKDYVEQGTIWPSLSTENEMVGTEKSSKRNQYWVAQVYEDTGNDGHVQYTLVGWLHITTKDLETLVADTTLPLCGALSNLYWSIKLGAPTV
jgi:hypothetical protein